MLVCVKQVPDTTEIKIDPVRNTLIREGVPSIVNPYDGYALEAAARIKDQNPADCKIVVLCMGPDQAKAALRECLSVGADKAYLATDRAFSGSDTLATSYVINQCISKVEELEGKFDIIFFGKQAIDGDTAQVGPQIAERRDIPQITYGVDVSVEGDLVKVERETDIGHIVVGAKMPCAVTMTKPAYDPRYPSIKSKMAAKKAEIGIITAADIEFDPSHAGLKGSPTQVKRTFVPQRNKDGQIIEGAADAAAGKLAELLHNSGII